MLGVFCFASLGANFAAVPNDGRVLLRSGYGAASGNNHNDTQVAIVSTLAEVADRIEVALAEAAGSTDIVVELAPGSHRVPVGGLRLSTKHTPSSARHTVTWRCGNGPGSCSVHGGEAVTSGWKPCTSGCATSGTMSAQVPPTLKGKTLRHLYINGRRADRTRSQPDELFGSPPHYGLRFFGPVQTEGPCNDTTPQACPNKPSHNYCESNPAKDQCELPPVKTCPPCSARATTNSDIQTGYDITNQTVAQGNLSRININVEDIEFVYPDTENNWAEARCAAQSVDPKRMRITMQQPCHWNLYHRPWQPAKGDLPHFIDNVRSELKQPGQWYYDKSAGQLLYLPREGEDMSTATAVIAVEETLVEHNASARHLWHGVTFEYATWLRPMLGDGYVEVQSGACSVCPVGQQNTLGPPYNISGCGGGDVYTTTPGNVVVRGGMDITFAACTFQHLGAYAAAANGGSQRISWRNCTFSDVSSGALMLGGLDTCDEKDVTKWDQRFAITDSKITNLPVEYTGATAVFFGYVDSSVVEHNLIENTSYSAMTIGWGWGRTGCGRGNNSVVANVIANSNLARCCDGGQVYTLGPQPNSRIERNHLTNYHGGTRTDHHGNREDPNAIYHDNGSGGFTDSQNVIEGHYQHYCGENSPVGCVCSPPSCVKTCSLSCPDRLGKQRNCSLNFTGNWLYNTSLDQHEQCDAIAGNHVTGTVNVTEGMALPPVAAVVVKEAGPRM